MSRNPEYYAAYNRETYWELKRMGRCRCGKTARPGMHDCMECARRRSENYYWRIVTGHCVVCRKMKPEDCKTHLCPECLAKARERKAKKKAEKKCSDIL